MKIENKKLFIILPLVILWLCALGFATVYDLNISLAVADESSVFGRIFEIAGEPPAILFASFNLSLICSRFLKTPSIRMRECILATLAFIGVIGTAFYAFRGIFNYLSAYGIYSISMPSIITITGGVSALLIILTARMQRETLDRYFSTACHCVAAATATLVIIWIFKLTWGRVRFRQMDGDLTLFTPWYLPRGFTGFFSFPSGHTANATVIFSVIYYLRFLPKRLHRLKPLILTVLGIWIAVVASSRVFVGAHFLSDVLFGMAITFAIVYFARPRNLK